MQTAPRARRGGTIARLGAALCGATVAVLAGWWLATPDSANEAEAAAAGAATRPNFVVVETDDQTVHQFGRGVMPFTERRLAKRGTKLTRFMVTSPFCCPSRGGTLTGQYAHNHGAWNSYATFSEPNSTLASWLKADGYRTAMVGKYLNHYDNAVDPPARPEKGWSQWRHLLPPLTYYDYSVSVNGRRVHRGDRRSAYQTTYLNREADDLVRNWAGGQKPFFLWLTPHAPHGENGHSGGPCSGKAVPAPGDEDLFLDGRLPHGASFNERKISDKPPFMRQLPRLHKPQIAKLRHASRCRLASLREVDRGVKQIFHTLKRKRALDETVIVFTSDNGLFEGEHRLAGGKRLPYREAIEVPTAAWIPDDVVGANVPGKLKQPIANIDLAPTFLELAGAEPCRAPGDCRTMDGRSIVPLLQGDDGAWPADRGVGVEMHNCRYSGIVADDQIYVVHKSVPINPTRTQGCEQDETIEHYDLGDDPHQLRNLGPGSASAALVQRQNHLSDCTGIAGRDPAPPPGRHYCE
ncbi:MAG: sulfatase [bacterium]